MTDITYRVEGNDLIPNSILDDEADDGPEEDDREIWDAAGEFSAETPACDIHGNAPDGKAYDSSAEDCVLVKRLVRRGFDCAFIADEVQ